MHTAKRATTGAGAQRKVTPLYHQVYVALRDKIQLGEYPPDEPLPGEHKLADDYGVSRVTIRHTLKNLEIDGFVARKRGVGTFPLACPTDIQDRYNIRGMLETSAQDDAPATVRTLTMREIECPPHIARQLHTPATVLRLQRLRSIKGEPFTIVTAYLPPAVAAALDEAALRKEPTLEVMERSGLVMQRADQSISAVAADEHAARLLRVPPGAPLLSMSALFSGPDDEPYAVLEGLFRPELYEYQTSAVRERAGRGLRWVPLP